MKRFSILGRSILFIFLVALDQLTKELILSRIRLGEVVSVIPNFFNLTLVYNPGAAFGMFSGLEDTTRRLMLVIVSVLALLVVVRFMFKEARDDVVSQYALVAVLSGALGNLIDRVRFDAVVDFLDFYWKTYHWPAFNVADSAISIGVTVLMIRMIFAKPPVVD